MYERVEPGWLLSCKEEQLFSDPLTLSLSPREGFYRHPPKGRGDLLCTVFDLKDCSLRCQSSY